MAQNKSQNSAIQLDDLKQDSDVLDTWFSSWLWPISVFDGIRNPEMRILIIIIQQQIWLQTRYFILAARMIVAGFEASDKKPFENVYLTGLVRDKQRRKMSKSLGNSPDALQLIEQFGADCSRRTFIEFCCWERFVV